MTVSGNPPYSWGYGTNLAGDFFYSRIFCEAMQALKNRADNASVVIPNWSAYTASGSVLADLGQTPADAALQTSGAWRHVNTLLQLRTALEAVLGSYYDGSGNPYTLASLLTAAVSRATWNRTTGQLQALGYFDGEDVEEVLKAIDLLLYKTLTLVPLASIYMSWTRTDTPIVSLPLGAGYPTKEAAFGAAGSSGGGNQYGVNVNIPLPYAGGASSATVTYVGFPTNGYIYGSNTMTHTAMSIVSGIDPTKRHLLRLTRTNAPNLGGGGTVEDTQYAAGVVPTLPDLIPLQDLAGYNPIGLPNDTTGTSGASFQIYTMELTA